MKRIEAVISPDAASAVMEMLSRRAISNFTLYNIMAKDSFNSHIQTYRGVAYAVDLSPEVKVEAVVPDNQATATAHAILDAARGPGRSFKPRVIIAPVTEVILDLHDSVKSGGQGSRRDRPELRCEDAKEQLHSEPGAALDLLQRPSAHRVRQRRHISSNG